VEHTSFSLSLNASDWEYRCFNDQNFSSKSRASHSLLKELNLAMSELTPIKRKLYHRVADKCSVSLVNRTSTLCA
jgi:hypothetical protein